MAYIVQPHLGWICQGNRIPVSSVFAVLNHLPMYITLYNWMLVHASSPNIGPNIHLALPPEVVVAITPLDYLSFSRPVCRPPIPAIPASTPTPHRAGPCARGVLGRFLVLGDLLRLHSHTGIPFTGSFGRDQSQSIQQRLKNPN